VPQLAEQRDLAVHALSVGLVLEGEEDLLEGEGLAALPATHPPHMAVRPAADFGLDLEALLDFLLDETELPTPPLLRVRTHRCHYRTMQLLEN
jgi:hypothetical protein